MNPDVATQDRIDREHQGATIRRAHIGEDDEWTKVRAAFRPAKDRSELRRPHTPTIRPRP